jgi:MFS family permease
MAEDARLPESSTALQVWAPLRERVFRAAWIAAVVSICAIWMQDVAAAWFVKELTAGDPLAISLVQVAISLPVLLLVVPAGTLGDLLDRRRVLAWALAWLALCGAGLTWAAQPAAAVGLPGLLALTLLSGAGKAVILPAFSATGAELAQRSELQHAVALHSAANNVARIAGPGVAGALLVAAGVPTVFAATLAAYLLAWLLVLSIPPGRFAKPRGVSQRYWPALLEGLLHCARDLVYRRVILRVVVFFCCAVAVHGMLPLLVTDARWFGLGWAAYGVGAIVGVVLFPRVARSLDAGRQLSLGIGLHAVMMTSLAIFPANLLRTATLFVLGIAWYVVVSGGQLAVQRELPDALRARGMAVFTMTMMAGFVAGALLWGALARVIGVQATLLAAAATGALGLAATFRLSLKR